MPRTLIALMDALSERWRFATPMDFLILALAIVAIGWLIAQITPD